MLTKHPLLAGNLVEAWTEPAMRDNGEATRYRLVCDENDDVLGAVSDRYRLVRNADLVAALDLEADRHGLTLEPRRAAYRRGRSVYSFAVPSLEYNIPGDPSKLQPTIMLRNDYRGGGGLIVESGYLRLICANGAVAGRVAYHDWKRHVGGFSLPAFVRGAIDKLREIFDADRVEAERMAAARIVAGGELLTALLDDTAKRYQPDLARAVRENIAAIGPTAWAYAQAVSEVATHRMQERTHFNFAADPWATRMVALVREHAEGKTMQRYEEIVWD